MTRKKPEDLVYVNCSVFLHLNMLQLEITRLDGTKYIKSFCLPGCLSILDWLSEFIATYAVDSFPFAEIERHYVFSVSEKDLSILIPEMEA